MSIKSFLKLFLLPAIFAFFVSCCLFIGGIRVGARLQLEQDEPFFDECISELRSCMGQFTVTPLDGGTE